jgi:hypothetical protein
MITVKKISQDFLYKLTYEEGLPFKKSEKSAVKNFIRWLYRV